MESDETKKEHKRLYEKPKLRTIELAAEEVLAVGCKLNSGPISAPYNSPCTASSCADAGT